MGLTVINAVDPSIPEAKGLWLGDHDPIPPASLTVNLVCRVVFGLLSNLLMWVPLKLLHRNGEFAVVVLITAVMIFNFFTVINGLIWHTDDVSTWWMGQGYCDIFVYINYPIQTMYTSCVFAIMRNLAAQIRLMRVDALAPREKRRRNLIQALIIFPVPLVQLAWIYPTGMHRYYILTLAGCTWWPDASWPNFIFVVPQPTFALGAAGYAAVTFWRFRQLSKDTMSALSSSNSRAAARARRTKRRLYFMTLAILIPYLPILLMMFYMNMVYLLPLKPYSFAELHSNEGPLPWKAIILLPSRAIDFVTTNDRFMCMLTAIPVFGFFGLSKDAINLYREYLVALGLGRCWPALKEEYNPDITTGSTGERGILTSSETTQSYSKHTISVTHTNRSATPEPQLSGTPNVSLLARLLNVFRSRTKKAHRYEAAASRTHILGREDLEMRPTTAEPPAAMCIHDHGVGVHAGVNTRVWSRDEEAGEGPSRPHGVSIGQGL